MEKHNTIPFIPIDADIYIDLVVPLDIGGGGQCKIRSSQAVSCARFDQVLCVDGGLDQVQSHILESRLADNEVNISII